MEFFSMCVYHNTKICLEAQKQCENCDHSAFLNDLLNIGNQVQELVVENKSDEEFSFEKTVNEIVTVLAQVESLPINWVGKWIVNDPTKLSRVLHELWRKEYVKIRVDQLYAFKLPEAEKADHPQRNIASGVIDEHGNHVPLLYKNYKPFKLQMQ